MLVSHEMWKRHRMECGPGDPTVSEAWLTFDTGTVASELTAEIFGHSFSSRLNVQFLVYVPEVRTDSIDADAQFIADLFIGQAAGQ